VSIDLDLSILVFSNKLVEVYLRQTFLDRAKEAKKNCDGVSFERYKLAKKEAKKAVQNARAKVYKEVYEKLDTKEVEKDI